MSKRQAIWVTSAIIFLVRALGSEYDSREDGYDICKKIEKMVDDIAFDLEERKA